MESLSEVTLPCSFSHSCHSFEIFSGVPTDGLARSIDSNGNTLDVNLDMNNDITEDTVFLLRASRDLLEGDEVTISYDQVITLIKKISLL